LIAAYWISAASVELHIVEATKYDKTDLAEEQRSKTDVRTKTERTRRDSREGKIEIERARSRLHCKKENHIKIKTRPMPMQHLKKMTSGDLSKILTSMDET